MSALEDIRQKNITVNINGTDKELKFNLNAYASIEEELCVPMPDAFELLYGGSMKAMKVFLWAGLLHLDRNINMDEVGKIDNFEGIIESIHEAVEKSLPSSNDDE